MSGWRAKYGRGLVLLGFYGSHESLPRTLKRPTNWVNETTETIGSRYKITSVLNQGNVFSETRMTHRGISRKEATRPTPLPTPNTTTLLGTWNIRTMNETGKAAQISAEVTTYKLLVLGVCETRWIESRCIRLSTGRQSSTHAMTMQTIPTQRE